ncbi:hypothetical protein [Halorhabdus sp. CUG00001]|uniref:hypothetical protein n=1 Tax=Halorhabdus sp. CUG00001 TaxID=2600297 RepID=UPI00131AA8FD|nr:hypothetical protein [Halorhabdus sp. CUG00001]
MDDLAFVFAAGEGKFDEQGRYLARSITRTNPDAQIYAYIPDGEYPTHKSELSELATIVRSEPRIPSYGISRKIDALIAAEAVADEPYLLLLDTDTLVLDEISVHRSGSDLYLKPVDVGLQYWGRASQSSETWHDIATDADLPVPEWIYTSTFDKNRIPPYWNAGFVLSGIESFGSRWMDLVEELYPDIPYEWHADQVALGLLSQAYDVEVLDNRFNYPLHLRLQCRNDAVVIHYHNFQNLNKPGCPTDFMASIGMQKVVSDANYSRTGSVARYIKRKVLPLNEEHFLERAYNALFG